MLGQVNSGSIKCNHPWVIMATTKVKVPVFDSVNKPYEMYSKEVNFWLTLVSKGNKVDKSEQAVLLAYNLPDNDPSGIKEKLFLELDLSVLASEDGVTKYMEYMDNIFLKDDLSKTFEDYVTFDEYKRPAEVNIVSYINEFEKLYNRIKKEDCKLPQAVLAFKLLKSAEISQNDRLLVLTGIDYSKKTTLFDQAKVSLKKFAGEQAGGVRNVSAAIKLEPVFNAETVANLEHTLNAFGFYKKPEKRHGNKGSTSGYKGNSTSFQRNRGENKIEKPLNPTGPDGKPFLCSSCGSFRHMLQECPDSYENMKKRKQEGNVFSNDVLIASKGLLAYEASNKAVIDCGCSTTVAGQDWVNTYIDTLDDHEKKFVVWGDSDKYFKFGSGTLKSLNSVELPCRIGEKNVRLITDVVDSDIPLLLSSDSLKKAGGVIDLVNSRIKLFDEWIICDQTTSGLYCISLGKTEHPLPVSDICVAFEETDQATSKKFLLKLHRQFGHTPKHRLVDLLKDAGKWKDGYMPILKDIYDSCKTCKVCAKVPPRPICALPPASSFGEVLTMDLKECTGKLAKKHKYILHMIDAFTRYSVSVFLPRKLTSLVVNKVFECWISKYDSPKRIWTDLGKEFTSDEMKEMSEALGTELGTGGGYAGWMNGENERNHQVIDFCLDKILHEDPTINPETALAWAVNAKNTMKMNGGFSAHQLVFGKNPALPSVTTDKLPALSGATTSKTVADHITAYYAAKKAFVESECSERIRRALRHNVRSVEDVYKTGQKVYYFRDGRKYWRGPATVIGFDGCVVIIKHQDSVYRLAASRVKHVGSEFVRNDEEVNAPSDPVPTESGRQTESVSGPKIVSVLEKSDAQENVSESENHSHIPFVDGSSTPTTPAESPSVSNTLESDRDTTRTPGLAKSIPKKNDVVRYKPSSDSDWVEGKVISRAGKTSAKFGRNQYCVNLQPTGESSAICVDLKKVDDWECVTDILEDVCVALVPKVNHNDDLCIAAKEKELNSFHEFGVYELVKDDGQPRISTMWVVTEKYAGKDKIIKARLVARGFQEKGVIQSDSPTCNKDSLRMFLVLAASNNWDMECTDIKSAFLQGKQMSRKVFVEPPPEAKVDGYLWLLNKCIYGLQDASRQWYLSVLEVLIMLGCIQLKLDLAVFVYYIDGALAGVIIIHVDDFLHIGNAMFYANVISKLRSTFKVSQMSKSVMSYIGMEIAKGSDHIVLSQLKYINSVNICSLSLERRMEKQSLLVPVEHEHFRKMVGQLNWAARQTRPDLMFDVLELSMKLSQPCVQDYLRAVKAVQKLKGLDMSIRIPCFKNSDQWKILVWSDAAFANLSDKVSSGGGYVIFLVDSSLNCAPLCWKTNKIKRVVRSTLAAEALILESSVEHALYLRDLLKEMLGTDFDFPIYAWTDNNNAFKAVHSTSFVDDHKLRIDIACLKENIQAENVEVKWCKGDKMLANCLTKKGASPDSLLQTVSTGTLRHQCDPCDLI